jgi:hypothetical protein
MNNEELNRRVERQLENLRHEFADEVPAGEVTALGQAHFDQLVAEARINDFIPVLMHRFTREELLRVTHAELHRAA